MNTLITVVIPVYNCENTLHLTMDGILNQTYKDIEIILVDDGSTDSSLDVCNKYKAQDSRINVIHQENKGLSGARNTGTRNAHGEYISYIDAGDIVETDLYETLLPYIKEKIDFIEYPYYVMTNDGNRYDTANNFIKNKIYDRAIIDDELLPCLLNLKENINNFALNFVWRILYKKSIIDDNIISFDENVRKWEDREFIIQYINCCQNVIFSDKPLYTYVCGDSQDHLASKYYKTLLNECIEKTQQREIAFKDKYEFNGEFYINHLINVYYGRLLEVIQKENEEDAKELINNFVNDEFVISVFERLKGKHKNINKNWVLDKQVSLLYKKIKKSGSKRKSNKKFRYYLSRIKHKILK